MKKKNLKQKYNKFPNIRIIPYEQNQDTINVIKYSTVKTLNGIIKRYHKRLYLRVELGGYVIESRKSFR